MKDFRLTASTLNDLAAEVGRLITTGKAYRVSIVEWRDKRSLSQNSLYWKWLAEIDKQNPLEVVNSKDCGAELWHEVFKKFYCPERIVSNGNTELAIVQLNC